MTARRSRARAGSHGGQSLVEFALVAPIFFLVVFTIIQLGLIFGTQNGLVNGVREAARRAATYRINDGSFDAAVWGTICGAVRQEVYELGDRGIPAYVQAHLHPTVAYEWKTSPTSGEYFLVAYVSATYDHQLFVPIVSWIFDAVDGSSDGFLTLSASEQMRVENPALTFATSPAAPPACP